MAAVHIAVGVGGREGVRAKRRVQGSILAVLAIQAALAMYCSATAGEDSDIDSGWPEVPVCCRITACRLLEESL